MLKPICSTENMTRDEWLEWRRKGIGGSDVSIICGINKYRTEIELWLDKLGKKEPEETNEAAYWGTTLEPIVRNEFTKRTGFVVRQLPYIFQHPKYDFMFANLDGIVIDPETQEIFIFEAKTASQYSIGDWDLNIPEAYQLQVQHYMAVTGFTGAYVAVLIGGNQFKYYFISRDEVIINSIISLEMEFWNKVISKTPPEIDGSKASQNFINNLFPTATIEEELNLPEEALPLINLFEEADKTINIHTQIKEEAATKLKGMIGDHSKGIISNHQVIWSNVSSERFDTKSFKLAHPDIYRHFTNVTSYRRFTIK